jgi:hypothetical protein
MARMPGLPLPPATQGTPAATSFAVLYCSIILLFALYIGHSGEVVVLVLQV